MMIARLERPASLAKRGQRLLHLGLGQVRQAGRFEHPRQGRRRLLPIGFPGRLGWFDLRQFHPLGQGRHPAGSFDVQRGMLGRVPLGQHGDSKAGQVIGQGRRGMLAVGEFPSIERTRSDTGRLGLRVSGHFLGRPTVGATLAANPFPVRIHESEIPDSSTSLESRHCSPPYRASNQTGRIIAHNRHNAQPCNSGRSNRMGFQVSPPARKRDKASGGNYFT